MGTGVNSPGVKYQGREVDPSFPSGVEVKNEGNPIPTLPCKPLWPAHRQLTVPILLSHIYINESH